MQRPKPFNVTRRRFMQASALLAASPLVAANPHPSPLLLSAQGRSAEQYSFGWMNNAGLNKQSLSGFRGHATILHPSKPAVALMVARRPGTKITATDLLTSTTTAVITAPSDRYFVGHGCFTNNNELLLPANTNSAAGKILKYRGDDYRYIGEFDSYGIGPHEVKMLPNSNTVVIANGGIATHPSSGRNKLNLATMDSNLSYVNCDTGQLLQQHRVKEDKASIRHIDIASDGTVAVAMQYQREASSHNAPVPLAALQQGNQAIELLPTPPALLSQLQDYVGSVAINNRYRSAGFTSPKGNVVCFWHLDSGRLLGHYTLHDACGLATSPDQKYFVVTNSKGHVRHLDAQTLQEQAHLRHHLPNIAWDNHLTVTKL